MVNDFHYLSVKSIGRAVPSKVRERDSSEIVKWAAQLLYILCNIDVLEKLDKLYSREKFAETNKPACFCR